MVNGSGTGLAGQLTSKNPSGVRTLVEEVSVLIESSLAGINLMPVRLGSFGPFGAFSRLLLQRKTMFPPKRNATKMIFFDSLFT